MHVLLASGFATLLQMVTIGHMTQMREQAHASMRREQRGQRVGEQVLRATAFGCCTNLALPPQTEDQKARREWSCGAVECVRSNYVWVWFRRRLWPIRNSARGRREHLCRQVARQRIGT